MNSERDGKNEKLINKTIPQLLEMNKRKSKFQKEFALEKVNERRNEISKKYVYMVTRTEQVKHVQKRPQYTLTSYKGLTQ